MSGEKPRAGGRPATFIEVVSRLLDEVHRDADKVVLVINNLKTHKIASLDQSFSPEQTRWIATRLETSHTS